MPLHLYRAKKPGRCPLCRDTLESLERLEECPRCGAPLEALPEEVNSPRVARKPGASEIRNAGFKTYRRSQDGNYVKE